MENSTEARAEIAAMVRSRQTQADNQDYLDRVALEAMKQLLGLVNPMTITEESLEQVAKDSYAISRFMLKARSQGGAE